VEVSGGGDLLISVAKVLHKNKQHTQKLAMKQRYKFMVISTTGAPTLRYDYTHTYMLAEIHTVTIGLFHC